VQLRSPNRRWHGIAQFAGTIPLLIASTALAQPAPTRAETLTLGQAVTIALANHPRVRSAQRVAGAEAVDVSAVRSTKLPSLSLSVTSVVAQEEGIVAAGALTTSSLANRLAAGLTASQLVTDFGRTSALVDAAALRAAGQLHHVDDVKAAVRLLVAEAYYEALGARAVLIVAKADLEARRILQRQVTALAASELKSTLDVGFASVSVLEAEVAVARAEGSVQASNAELAAAMGTSSGIAYELVDEPMPGPLDANVDALIDEATRQRSDLLAGRISRDAAFQFAHAERRLRFPTVSLQAVAGAVPIHDQRLQNSYSAAGVNVAVPVLNGGLFAARQTDAALRAGAAAEDVKELTVAIARDVRMAWVEADTTFKRLALRMQLVEQAERTLRLAEARYAIGLTSIVEINQAQLSATTARINAARDRYEYLVRRAVLDRAIGR
jgi:outer membrane protein